MDCQDSRTPTELVYKQPAVSWLPGVGFEHLSALQFPALSLAAGHVLTAARSLPKAGMWGLFQLSTAHSIQRGFSLI